MYRRQSAKCRGQQAARLPESRRAGEQGAGAGEPWQGDNRAIESRMLPFTACINKTAQKYKQYAKHDEDCGTASAAALAWAACQISSIRTVAPP